MAGLRTDPRELAARLRFSPSQGVSWYSTSPSVADKSDLTIEEQFTATAAPQPIDFDQTAAHLGIDLEAPDLRGEVRRIEDPTGRAMEHFYAALTRSLRGEPGSITRVLHYGDSLVVVDFLTGELRRRLQARFGDAGHGYMLAGKPWPWYQHWDVRFSTAKGWRVDGVMKPQSADGYYGLGGYGFDGSGPEHYAEWGTATSGDFGRRVGRFEIHYLARPGGGSFRILVDGREHERVATAADTPSPAMRAVTVPDGPHTFRVQCVGDGPVRLFGGVLERDTSGLVYDTLGINGGRARTLERIDADFWAAALRARRPDLVVINFGTNESEDRGRPMATVQDDYRRILERIRAAVPEASCLVMSPPDRAARVDGKLTTMPIVPRLVDTQRRAALQAGCAFYDTYSAMGGFGAMAGWYESTPRLCAGDMTHPNRQGADLLGDGLYRGLVTGLLAHAGLAMRRAEPPRPPEIVYRPLLPDQPDPFPPLPERPRPGG